MNPPSAFEISAARAAAGLTQAQSAALVYVTLRGWQFWESGARAMPAATFELFLLKTKQRTLGEALRGDPV